MATSSPHPNTFVRLVVYCDEEPEPYTLPDMHLPRNLEELRRIVEDKVGQRAKLLSYWNYGHNRYELLREVKALLQEDARVPAGSPSKSRQDSRRQSLEREAGTDTSTSHSGRSSAVAATRPSSRVHRCQLWLETVLLQLDPLDPQRDAAEYDDLHGHVARWLGNKHVGYEVRDAVRIRCPFLTRMFDETRSTRLVGNQDKVQLLYYSNNAWGVRDVLQYGFLLNRGVPTSMTAVVQAQSGASDISTTTDTRLSIPVPPNAQGPSASGPTDSQPAPPSPVDDVLDSQAHPFIFTSSMLGPNVKHLPAQTAPHKVLLCEVAPGRRFMTDQSLTGEHTDKQSFPLPSLKTPRGYDSVCYTRTKDDKAGLRSGDEVSAKAEDLAVVQVQVAHSYQALPRYLVTVAPTGAPPPAPSSFDSAVSATASPVRAPGSTAAAAAAREDVEKQRAAEAASRPSRLREWWSANPFQSRKRAEAKNEGTPLRRPGSASAPTPGMASAPRSALESPNTRRHSDRYGNSSSENVAPQRAALALTTPRHHTESSRRFSGTPYPDSEYRDDRGGEAVRTPRAYSSSQSQPHPAGAAGPLQSPAWLSPSRPSFAHGGLHQACGAEGGPPPQQMSLSREGSRNQNTFTPARPSQPRASGGLSLAPPTPLSPAHPGSSPGSRNGILYSGLQPSTRRKSDGVSAPHQPLQPHSQDILERSGCSRNAHSASQDEMVERPWTRPLIPVYHDTAEALNSSNDRYGDSGGGGGVGAPLPGPLPPPSIMRQRAPSFSSSPLQRPAQAPPAAFNHFLCAIHPRQLQSLYCTACEELTCAYCASIGAHRDHVVVEASNQVTAVYAEAHKLQEELRHWLSEYRRTEQELHAEQAKAAARQQRELRTLQQNFQLLRQSLQQAERTMTQTVQQRTCPPPLAEATAVVNKYVQALTPLSAMLNRYHAAQEQGRASASPPAGGARGATSSLPEMLHFLRVAPSLVHRVQESFVQHQKDEERRLRDGIAEYRTRVATTEGTYDQVDWMGLRRLLEHIGSSRSTRAANTATMRERSPCHPSPPRATPVTAALSFSGLGSADKSGGRTGSAVRVRGRTSLRSSPTRNAAAADSRDVSRRLLGRSPVRPLVIGDNPAAYMSHEPSPSSSCKRDRLLLRCLADLQRGHIWAIQDASAYFAPGQLKAVCSTAFRLLGVQWELRIAPLPSSHRRASTTSFITPGINAGLMATTASTLPPADREGGMDGVVARSPLATQSWLDEERAVLDPSASVRGGAPEEEWLGFFLFPLQHRLRMDFRVIAFSEVTWAEWQVTGWTTEMVGKGWGLYPFLQRKELMRTDKLARDNIVKICIAPISDLY